MTNPRIAPGPFRADQLRSGDRYELSQGHPVYCAPTGQGGSGPNGRGFAVLDSDPAVTSAGVDTGLALSEDTLRAPDVTVNHEGEAGVWATRAPLVVEYADRGQKEHELRAKIAELLTAGTRWVWVVRLVGPRRVEVHEAGQPVKTLGPGESLAAPGVLQNTVPVEAMYDRDAAHEVTLRNLLQRAGYASLDAVREEGREEGALRALAESVLTVIDVRGLAVSDAQRERVMACRDRPTLERWQRAAVTATSVDEALG
ncbi:MAG: hypothetical protein R3A52_32870 [Polyangiales bacterium]